MSEVSARLALPLLVPGQAQKEMTHNEALAMLDIALGARVIAVGLATPPAGPVAGQCWIVGAGATGAWAGQADAIAGWTAGGWRFVAGREGLTTWDAESGSTLQFRDGGWRTGQAIGPPEVAIAAPVGGTIIDGEARTAISAILLALQRFALIDRN